MEVVNVSQQKNTHLDGGLKMKFITEEQIDIVNADYCDDGIKYYYHLEEVIDQIN